MAAMENGRSRVLTVMVESLYRTWTEIRDELEGLTLCVEAMIEGGAPVDAVREEYDAWKRLRTEFREVDYEISRCLHGEELTEYRSQMAGLTESQELFVGKSESYLELYTPVRTMDSAHRPFIKEVTTTYFHERSGSSARGTSFAESSSSPDVRHTPSFRTSDREMSDVRRQAGIEPQLDGRLRCDSPAFTPRASSSATDTGGMSGGLKQESEISSRSETLDVLSTLVEKLDERRDRLPEWEPEVFSGEVMDFPSWITTFETMVESKARTSRDKLMRLGWYVKGDALDAIKCYLSIPNDPEAYEDAKRALYEEFGDKLRISEAFRKKLQLWPTIKPGDAVALRKFANFLNQCRAAMKSISYLSYLNSREEITRMSYKLPYSLTERWQLKADRMMNGDDKESHVRLNEDGTVSYPSMQAFCKYVETEARIARTSRIFKSDNEDKRVSSGRREYSNNYAGGGGRGVQQRYQGGRYSDTRAQHTVHAQQANRKEEKPKYEPTCFFCSKPHFVSQCEAFLKQSRAVKKAFARQKRLCYGCLRRGHVAQACEHENPALMQDNGSSKPEAASEEQPVKLQTMKIQTRPGSAFTSMILPIKVYMKGAAEDDYLITHAMLDTQSDGCFVTESLARQLGVTAPPIKLEVTTLGSTTVEDSQPLSDVVVQGIGEIGEFKIPVCYTRNTIPCNRAAIPTSDSVGKWPHLQHLALQFQPEINELEVGLLLGHNMPGLFRFKGTVEHPTDFTAPYAIRGPLGWLVMGQLEMTDDSEPYQVPEAKYCFRTAVKPVTRDDIKTAFDVEFKASHAEETRRMSANDEKFMKVMREGAKFTPSGKVELPLPSKEVSTELPDSKWLAIKRLIGLKQKFKKNPRYKEKYVRAMRDAINKGYLELVPEEELLDLLCWYIPHHGVDHPRKPDKVQVVNHMSIEIDGVNLNELLLSGPDLSNDMTGILLRFRKERVGLTCDVESMFCQVMLEKWYRRFARIVWFENDDIDGRILSYQFTSHLFGATSSPGCANYALKLIAEEFKKEHCQEAANFLQNNFYVDDGVEAKESVQKAIELMQASHEMCKSGGMNLRQYASNSPDVIMATPQELRAKELTDWKPGQQLPVIVTLGLGWCLQTDTLRYVFEEVKRPDTRRGYLSALSGVYDPLGLISPVLLLGRLLLQRLCQDNLSWDVEVPADIKREWDQWYQDLQAVKTLMINRCIRKELELPLLVVILHVFTDASNRAYGVCCYLQLGQGACSEINLVFAKSRVGPTKPVTIPRMELQAAVLGVKTAMYVKEEIKYENIVTRYYTDSKSVLGFVTNELRRFHLYTRNRAGFIREHSAVEEWNFVRSEDNPADIASWGCTVEELRDSRLWNQGPEFLKQEEAKEVDRSLWAEFIEESNPEVKKGVTTLNTISKPRNRFLEHLGRFSSWDKIVGIMTRVTYVARLWLGKVRGRPQATPADMVVTDKERAVTILVEAVQREHFPKELQLLQHIEYPVNNRQARLRRRDVQMDSNLYRLDPYVDNQGVLRVGGRFRWSDMPEKVKHPILLPEKSPVVSALIRHYHERAGHYGPSQTVSQMREAGWWVCHCKAAVVRITRKCVLCRRFKFQPERQKMADLPEDRVTPAPAFTYSAVDFFGPFYVKNGRREMKRYGCIFVCQASRAIHLEMADTLSTDSFLMCYRRFAGRRGPIRQLRSDRGTNIVGARNELGQALAEMDRDVVRRELLKADCDWVEFRMNPPRASHMGGSWERLIRSVRASLNGLLFKHKGVLNDEELRTMLVEAEAVVNSRPIGVENENDATSEPPITPFRLLTLKDRALAPLPGVFTEKDVDAKKRWRAIEHLANSFWKQWRKSYLPLMQERRKEQRARRNVSEGDIVLVADSSLPRGQWRMGVVQEAIASRDGLVRQARVRTQDGEMLRPVTKLLILVETDVRPVEEPSDE